MRGGQADAQGPARGAERRGQVGLAVVAHDRLRDDHRPGRGMRQPLINRGQALVRQHRAGQPQRVGPARPHRLGRQRPGQQQRGIHRLGGRPQHRRGDGAGGLVDQAGQLDPVHGAVVVHHPDIQRGGIDLRPLTRPGRGHRAERPLGLAGQRPAGAGRAEGVPARGQASRQPVEGPLGRHRRQVAAWAVLARIASPGGAAGPPCRSTGRSPRRWPAGWPRPPAGRHTRPGPCGGRPGGRSPPTGPRAHTGRAAASACSARPGGPPGSARRAWTAPAGAATGRPGHIQGGDRCPAGCPPRRWRPRAGGSGI